MTSKFLLAAAATIMFAGCAPGATTQHATRPTKAPKTSTASVQPTGPVSPIVDAQAGFETTLPPPDSARSGVGTAYNSDVGAPRWRNNPGSFDDGIRPKSAEAPSNQNAIQRNRSLPPTTTGTEQ